ncbi:hypothetical protein FACS189487_03610 [Campylobacterota bacterium]|nr:hypothetical protein FACS189487_03610 [Campylobacterota bacterium]
MNNIYVASSALALYTDGIERHFDIKSLRRLDPFTKYALKAAAECLLNADIALDEEKYFPVIIATGYGPVSRACAFMDSIIDDGDECASPLAFSSSVHNAALTAISILLRIRGACLTISNLETSFESALLMAKVWLNNGTADRVLVGAVDEKHNVATQIFPDKPSSEGAAFFLLTNEKTEGVIELPDIVKTATPFNPAQDAFALARNIRQPFNFHNTQRVAADFIKTQLAGSGRNIMGVFESVSPNDLLNGVDDRSRKEILSELNALFTGDNSSNIGEDISKECFAKARKYQLINFHTSGSTGARKKCEHTAVNINEEVEGTSSLFNGVKRIVCTVPVSHSYGFIFGCQMPAYLGVPFQTVAPIASLRWENILKEHDLLVAFPMFLEQLRSFDFYFPKGITILTSTAPCPDELIDSLYQRGAQKVIEIYGASESGAIGYRESVGAFRLLPFWTPTIIDGKLEAIERKKTALKIDIPDIIHIDENNFFNPEKRKDSVVQVAGINVSIQKVEQLLKTYPAIEAVAIRKMRPDEGERLKAFLVLKRGFSKERVLPDLRRFMKEHLTAHETPRKITIGGQIPVTDFGKRKDW